jgi:tetratricopeptide (TPR) repeat protein
MTEKRPTLRDRMRAFRGARHLVMGRYEEALADYGRAIELSPANARAFIGRGHTYLALKRMTRPWPTSTARSNSTLLTPSPSPAAATPT